MADPMNASIVEHFRTLEDPRVERTKRHLLLDILVIAVCTLLTGGEGFQDMAHSIAFSGNTLSPA